MIIGIPFKHKDTCWFLDTDYPFTISKGDNSCLIEGMLSYKNEKFNLCSITSFISYDFIVKYVDDKKFNNDFEGKLNETF